MSKSSSAVIASLENIPVGVAKDVVVIDVTVLASKVVVTVVETCAVAVNVVRGVEREVRTSTVVVSTTETTGDGVNTEVSTTTEAGPDTVVHIWEAVTVVSETLTGGLVRYG